MSTTTTLKHLAASTATAAVLAASAGTAGLCLTTTAAVAAAVPGGTVLRTLHDDEFQTAAGGLRTPTVQPAARILGETRNS
jgi:hypothetical protein